MLKKKRQQKYLVKRCLEMRRQLHAFAGSGSQEALHKLRVEIKKIRAVEKFTTSFDEKKEDVRLKGIKKVFHAAGTIREANFNLQMMKQYHIKDPAFSADTTHTLQQESEKFRLHAARNDKRIRNTVESLLRAIHSVRNSDIRRWFTRQLKRIATGITASSIDQLHDARKNIKTLLYVHGMLHKQLVESLKLNTIYLDQLQDDIGKWHDTAVAVRLLASGDAGNKAKVGRLQKDQDKAGEAIHAAGNGFWDKVIFPVPRSDQ